RATLQRCTDGRFECTGPRPVAQLTPLDEDARRVDRMRAARIGEQALPVIEFAASKGVLPTDVVPVADMHRQRDDPFTVALAQSAETLVGRWTTGAALGGKEFDNDGRLRARLDAAQCRGRSE